MQVKWLAQEYQQWEFPNPASIKLTEIIRKVSVFFSDVD